MNPRIGLYGGSFDPIHVGHLIVARSVAEALDLDRVLLLPAAQPPHKDGGQLAAPHHRGEMVRLAIEGETRLGVDFWDLHRSGPAFTLDCVRHFRRELGPHAQLYWIIGADSLRELPTWHRVGDLVDACEIVTAARVDTRPTEWAAFRPLLTDEQILRLRNGVLSTPTIEVSATEIRRRVHAGQSIRYLVPEVVRAYVEEHVLYR